VTYVASEQTPFGSQQDAQSWRDAAAAFVKAGPDRTLITDKGTSHEIPQDKPQLVVDEIEKDGRRLTAETPQHMACQARSWRVIW
jgi:hypothetical protein